MKKIFALLSFIALCNITAVFSQNADTKIKSKVKIYLDCNRPWLCDEEFLRTELKMVDYVRDRFLSDVQVISNVQFSGGGGEQNMLVFLGQNAFNGTSDTLRYFNNPTNTDDEKRRKMLQYLKIGLMRYIAQSPIGEQIAIDFKENNEDKDKQASSPQKDPWNYWQFSISTSGYFNGDNNYQQQDINMNTSANRETEKSRVNFDIFNNLSRQTITVNNEKVNIKTDRQGMNFSFVKKVNEHFGFGLSSEAQRSVFDNIDTRIEATPRIEYSFTPYKNFNTERLVLQYSIGPQYSNYQDSTLYDRTQEMLMTQKLGIIGSFTKPWGSLNGGVFWSNYFHDFNKNNLFIGLGISWRIFKGFQFGLGGNFQFIRDQISLPKQGASRDDVLTRRRLIATSYSYFGGVGFSYRFGSIYNSQVNPTFKGLNYSLNF
jgi:hypothetical protein